MVDASRVVQVTVRQPDSGTRLGSGYVIASGWVLTSGHVVAGATADQVSVTTDPDGRSQRIHQVRHVWAGPEKDTDLGLIAVDPAGCPSEWEPVRFGLVGDGSAVLEAELVGYPLYAADATPDGVVFRDTEQVEGRIPLASGRRSHSLVFNLISPSPPDEVRTWTRPTPSGDTPSGTRPPPQSAQDDNPCTHVSPWEGISGAAVWAQDTVVGVVSEHRLGAGAGRLLLRRLSRDALEGLLGDDLADLPGLPFLQESRWRPVQPPTASAVVRSAYYRHAQNLAPSVLLDRNQELAVWSGWCTDPDTPVYAWWQAGAKSGKTALAAWFVTHPPPGCDVVSFFLRRQAGFNTVADFHAAAEVQIRHLAPEALSRVTNPFIRFEQSLHAAAQAIRARGRTLLLVIDGLDEDAAGTLPGPGVSSIASCLPSRPPPGLKILLTSRPHPGLPKDVGETHPLRDINADQLPVSAHATAIIESAEVELIDLYADRECGARIADMCAAARGGLSIADLVELTELPQRDVKRVMAGRDARVFEPAPTHADPDLPRPQLYVFGHETLYEAAENEFLSKPELADLRDRIHQWIGSYADQGWPDDTPDYAVSAYPALLQTLGDTTRLIGLGCDTRRHAYLRYVTGTDSAALTQIIDTQTAVLRDHEGVNLPLTFLDLALPRLTLEQRTTQLPAAWWAAGRPHHAQQLAASITDPARRAEALTEVARAAADTGDLDRSRTALDQAQQAAATIENTESQARALTEVARAAVAAGNFDRAEQAAATIENTYRRTPALVAQAATTAGDLDRTRTLVDRAEQAAATIKNTYRRTHALTLVAQAATTAGDLDRTRTLVDRAEQVAATIKNTYRRTHALTLVAQAATTAGDLDRTRTLVDRAEQAATTIKNTYRRTDALTLVAQAATTAGDLDRAQQVAATIEHTYRRAETLTQIAQAATTAGDLNSSRTLLEQAEQAAATIKDASWRTQALTLVAQAATTAGDLDRTRTLVDRECASLIWPRLEP